MELFLPENTDGEKKLLCKKTFTTPFATTPTVQINATGGNYGVDYIKTTNVTKAGFTYEFEVGGKPGAGSSTITVTWNAVV